MKSTEKEKDLIRKFYTFKEYWRVKKKEYKNARKERRTEDQIKFYRDMLKVNYFTVREKVLGSLDFNELLKFWYEKEAKAKKEEENFF